MIELKPLNFKTLFRQSYDFYQLLEHNRNRLAPYFWWASAQVTSSFPKTFLFITGYILDTYRKRILHKINSAPYDEQFIIMSDNNVSGMIGLDNICTSAHDAEVWCFVSHEQEGRSVATSALQKLEEYSVNTLGLDSLYASIVHTNSKSKRILARNNYCITDIKHNVPISRRNPTLTDLIYYRKSITK